MGTRKFYIVLAAVAALAASSAQAEMVGKYTLVSALPRPGATKILDNDRGTVWDVIYPPGMSTGMHRHPSDFLGIELVETMLKVTTPDGVEHINRIPRGNIYMLPKGLTHIEEGVVGHPQRNSILIELKDAPHSYKNSGTAPEGFAAACAEQAQLQRRFVEQDVGVVGHEWSSGHHIRSSERVKQEGSALHTATYEGRSGPAPEVCALSAISGPPCGTG